MINVFIAQHKLEEGFESNARQYFVPLAQHINTKQSRSSLPFFVGINGCQGSGKSTLSTFLKYYINETFGLNVVAMSLDDFYYGQKDRHLIAKQIHPLLKTRGVPGTHNISLAKSVLLALKNQQSTAIPKFNKATDDLVAESKWKKVNPNIDVVIFEGWCWGITPQSPEALINPINTLESNHDKDGTWRQYVNLQISQHYQPLYELMDTWVYLKAPSFKEVFSWRVEQEIKLREATSFGNQTAIMDKDQVRQFIQHYQRLTEYGFSCLPSSSDYVFELGASRNIISQTLNTL